MGFLKKIWQNRQSEYANRRRLTEVSAGVYDVDRAEGVVAVEGDAFDATTMNDLENRIAAGFSDASNASNIASGILPVARGGTGAGDAAAARANLGAAPTSHTHVWANITNPPATYAPSAHNQAANTITAGTFPGAVVAQANANYTTPQIRNVVFYPKASYPNGVGLPALPDGTIALLFE